MRVGLEALTRFGEVTLRGRSNAKPPRRHPTLAADQGLAYPDLKDRVLPWLEESGLCRVHRRSDGELLSMDSLVLTYDSILRAVSRLYDGVSPTHEDIGCLHVLDMASDLPRPESEVMHGVALVIGDEKARTSVDLPKGYIIVSHRTGKGQALQEIDAHVTNGG